MVNYQATQPQGKQKTFTGAVIKTYDKQVLFRTRDAAQYRADTSKAVLSRKNGTPMDFPEIAVGDKVEIVGIAWPDNSVNALTLRNRSLYPRKGTFRGKVVATAHTGFDLETKQNGLLHIHTTTLTSYSKNKAAGTNNDVYTGVSATVKGLWERGRREVQALSVEVRARLVSIEITGTVAIKNLEALTVTSNNVIYGVMVSGARFVTKSGKTLNFSDLTVGGPVRVVGKHLPESPNIQASVVRDLTKQ